MRATMQQARPIVARRSDPRRRRALPVALGLTLLAVLIPELTLAPVVGGEGDAAPANRAAQARGALRVADALLGRAAQWSVRAERPLATDGAAFEAAIEAARAAAKAYGVTAAIVSGGELVWSGATGTRRDGETPLGADEALVIGSVMKTFIAATVLELAQERSLWLSDPVTRYLPEAPVGDDVTIHQLLDHSSGLADVFNDTTRRALEEHPERGWTSEQVMGALHAPWYDPGEDWAYANTNYLLLGLVIERVTGTPLEEVLEARFIGPLDLDETRLISATDPGELLAPAWATIFWASGAMVASAEDLATWGDALYGGAVLRPYMQAQMLDVNGHDYGLGVQRLVLDDMTGYGHTGLLNTYTTLLVHLPEDDVTIALLVNRTDVELGEMLVAHPPNGPSLLDLALGRPPRAAASD
jgi:D-alanyl-D-alanine carboxypeptidase